MAKKAGRPKIAACNIVTGSPVAGIILYRLDFWTPRIEKNGRLWLAKPHEELVFETGLTPKQIKTGLLKLKELGFIKTERHLFNGRNVLHILVTEQGKIAIRDAMGEAENSGKGTLQNNPDGTVPIGPKGTVPIVPSGTIHIHGVQQGVLQGVHHGVSGVLTNAGDSEGTSPEKESDMATVKDVLSSGLSKRKPKGLSSLPYAWALEVADVTQGFVPPLTVGERKSLSSFASMIAPHDAEVVMRFAIRNWSTFVETARKEEGAFPLPEKPKVWFLAKYAATAVNMWLKSKNAPKKQEAKTVKKIQAAVQLIAPAQEEEKADMPSLSDILGDEEV